MFSLSEKKIKKVLIVGSNSFVGNSISNWLNKFDKSYKVDIVGTMDNEWESWDFSNYSTVILVAGIVHIKNADEKLYDKINNKLSLRIFNKCCDSNCEQFIFMSTGAVYGQNDRKHRKIIVEKNTDCNPITPYAKSKYIAEQSMLSQASHLNLAIIRPPMIYGFGAKGNYNSLAKYTKKLHILPKTNNRRSMIYIDNFCEFIRLIIDNNSSGIFVPQNKEYVNTTEMMELISSVNNYRCLFTKAFNWFLYLLSFCFNSINKAFGTYIYKKEDFDYFNGAYQVVDFKTSIYLTEKGENHEQ